MKKLYSLLALSLFVPLFVFAQPAKAESSIFFLMDGGYTPDQVKVYWCFMDGKCYDKDMNLAPYSVVSNSKTSIDITPPQFMQTGTSTPGVDLKAQYQTQIDNLNTQIQTAADELEAYKKQLLQQYAGMTQTYFNQVTAGMTDPYVQKINKLAAERDAVQAKLNALQ